MTPRVLLHGFTGGPDSWDEVVRVLGDDDAFAPALLGHAGAPPAPGIETFEQEVDRLADAIRARFDARPHLAGYSLGGRVGLGLIIRHPDLFASATLIGANPGIPNAAGRRDRAAWDEEWARLLEREGLPSFVAAWEALPLFRTQARLDDDVLAAQRRARLAQDPAGLARSLRVLGLAAMPDYGPRLHEIRIPVRLVVGELDDKFRALAAAMAERLPDASVCVVAGAGHNVVLERPHEIARILEEQDR